MFSLRAEGFSCSLDVFYEGLGISKLQFLKKKSNNKFSAVFFQFLVIKTLDLDPDLDSLEMLGPDPDSMNPDSQHCLPQC